MRGPILWQSIYVVHNKTDHPSFLQIKKNSYILIQLQSNDLFMPQNAVSYLPFRFGVGVWVLSWKTSSFRPLTLG